MIDARFISKGGAVRKGRFRHRLLEDDIELPFCMLMTLEDVTDAAVPAEAARLYERLYRHVIDESTDSIAFLDRDGQVRFMNGAGLAGLGSTGGPAAVRCHYADLWEGVHVLAVRASVMLASKGRPSQFEAFSIVDGKPRWWEVRFIPIQDGEEGVTMILAISREITKLRREEERRHALEKLLNAAGACAGPEVTATA